ncbi:MAG: OprO/OprP family phosphate-selective porin [Algoriphagus sp.]|nr:OprO/OprP family phosphate-selective porin [Algoriphagus sp.]
MKRILLFQLFMGCLALALSQTVVAQNESDERSLLQVQKGISFTKDSLFSLNMRFRLQNRIGFRTESGEDLSFEQTDFRIRRLRVRLDGFVFNPRIQYYIQLGFSKSDMDLDGGEVAQPIRDAILYYHFSPNFYVGLGQAKLPGNRERVISSGNLQFAERSIANSFFTLDRDFGVFAYYTIPSQGKSVYQLKGAISSGEGRNPSVGDRGLSYTGRMEVLPFGKFTNGGDYSEGDLELEARPKLSLGASYNYNESGSRSRGQLGPELYQKRDQRVFIADMMLKYKGWALLGEYFSRNASNPITYNPLGLRQAVWVGSGQNFQVSKLISKQGELAIRYAQITPKQSIRNLEMQREETTLGYTHYVGGHRVKLQGNLGYSWANNQLLLSETANYWFGLFQVEFGI